MFASAYALDLTLTDDQRATFEACFRAHRHKVFRLGLRYGRGSETWAEDLTQEVFMKLLQELPVLTDHEDLGGWIYRVTTNAALSKLRRERSWLGFLEQMVSEDREPEDEVGADTRLELSETAREAEKLIASLPPKERIVLSMKVLDGLPQREIARALHMSEGYVSKLLSRAWNKVRAAGWDVGGEEAEVNRE
ncbi:MAG: sigma-70 family RNA polymerase sigma factor [Myxococcaceae bacterium]|nr:sigma-70 family RNA polymerase sigma factor [Myxococcaceae bacterium]